MERKWEFPIEATQIHRHLVQDYKAKTRARGLEIDAGAIQEQAAQDMERVFISGDKQTVRVRTPGGTFYTAAVADPIGLLTDHGTFSLELASKGVKPKSFEEIREAQRKAIGYSAP